MSLPTPIDQMQDQPASLGRLVPRWILVGCVAFWVGLSIAIVLARLPIPPLGWLLLAFLAACATFLIIHIGKSIIAALQSELRSLAVMARRDNKDDIPHLEFSEFSEFSEIAQEINESNRVYRDEMEHLRFAAYRDPNTALPNRLRFMAELKKGLETATEDAPCTVFHLITSGFQGANDLLGTTGNQRLQTEIASRLSLYFAASNATPGADTKPTFLASIGADQFGIFMPAGNGRDQATALAQDLRQLFQLPFTIDGRKIQVTISGGLAVAPEDSRVPEKLLKNAGLALNEVLRAGKAGFQYFSPRLERLAIGRVRFEQELRDAVEDGVFYPVFQPKINLSTGQIVGVEALARWRHSDGKTISPGTFIPLAEELGLIDRIGFQILHQSCKSASAWHRSGHDISVAVNVSPKQLERPDFAARVADALRTSRLPPHLLELEITETMAVSNPERVVSVTKPLRAIGVKLAIDDFGTGHANLSLLTQIPFDIFKIDRQFVMGLTDDIHAPAIVDMTVAMAKTLGLKIVAEGIETEAQASFLRARNCHLGQGYLFSPGVSDEKFRKMLSAVALKRA